MENLINLLKVFFSESNIEAYLVGGSIRDTMLGQEINDFDIAVNVNPLNFIDKLADEFNYIVIPIGRNHGLFRLVPPDKKENVIDLIGFPKTIEDELKERDFTINAMAFPLHEDLVINRNSIIDPLNGLDDLDKASIKAVNSNIFEKDPIRLIRAVRLASKLQFSIEENTFNLIKSKSYLISNESQERVRDELMKILTYDNSSQYIYLMDYLSLLAEVIPELDLLRNVEQPKEHHYWDVFNHSIQTLKSLSNIVKEPYLRDTDPLLRLIPWHQSLAEYFSEKINDGFDRLTLLKLTGLLHDIAKPQTKTIDETGRMRFLGHSEQGADIASHILTRLRFSKQTINRVCKMVEQHLRPGQISEPNALPSKKAIYKYLRNLGDVAIEVLYLNLADYLAARGPSVELEDWANRCNLVEYILSSILEEKECEQSYKLIDGHDIMNVFGLGPSPLIGELIEIINEAQLVGEILTKEEALELVNSTLKSNRNHA